MEGKERLARAFAAKMVRIMKKEYIQCLFHSFKFLAVMAALSVANIVKTSLGPVGLDKMLVDDVGVRKFFIVFLFHFLTPSACDDSNTLNASSAAEIL